MSDEQLAAELVRERLRIRTERARDLLWSGRAGLHLLTPEQAQQFAQTVGNLDKLLETLL